MPVTADGMSASIVELCTGGAERSGGGPLNRWGSGWPHCAPGWGADGRAAHTGAQPPARGGATRRFLDRRLQKVHVGAEGTVQLLDLLCGSRTHVNVDLRLASVFRAVYSRHAAMHLICRLEDV